jgi:hypothetical protein
MAVNETIWGSSDTWVNAPSNTKPLGKHAQYSCGRFVTNELWDLNAPIDDSVVYCGGVGDWYLSNPIVFFSDETKNYLPVYKQYSQCKWCFTQQLPYRSDNYNSGHNYTLSVFKNTGSQTINFWAEWATLSRFNNIQTTFGNAQYDNAPIFDIKIKKLMLVPYVKCAVSNTFDGNNLPSNQSISLCQYISNYNDVQTTHPYIIAVYFRIMYNSGTDDSPNWTTLNDQRIRTIVFAELSEEVQSEPHKLYDANESTLKYIYNIGSGGGGLNLGCLLIGSFFNEVNDSMNDSSNHPIGYDPDITHYIFNENRTRIMYCREWSDELLAEIRKQLAFYGCFYVCDNQDAQLYWDVVTLQGNTLKLTDNDMYLGTIEDGGYTYGNYTHGTDNADGVQYGWDTTNDSTYDPQTTPPEPPETIPPSNPTTFNPVSLADGGLKRYVLDDTSMTNFGAELWNVINTSNPDELIQNQTLTNFLTNNPLDCVVSIKRFPLADMRQGAATNPMLGKVKIPNVVVYPFDSSSTILSCGTKKIPRFFNDFRDYLVQYELILPFCGTISLDSAAVTGNEIEVKYAIDYTTGTCTAWVLANTADGKQVVIDSANGNCTIDIPLSGVQTATLTGQIYNANENLKTAKFNGIISGVTGAGSFVQDVKNRNIGGAIGTGAKIINAVHDVKKMEWNIEHTEIPLKMVGASSGCNSFQIELVPRLTAYVPNVTSDYSESDYLHNVGAAVCDTTTIGNYSGYAEITNVDMSGFAATSTEKNMIATALAGGVYL